MNISNVIYKKFDFAIWSLSLLKVPALSDCHQNNAPPLGCLQPFSGVLDGEVVCMIHQVLIAARASLVELSGEGVGEGRSRSSAGDCNFKELWWFVGFRHF